MGTWTDSTSPAKTPQTWVGLLTGSVDHEDKLRAVVEENNSDFLNVNVTRRSDDAFYATVEYGPVKGANRRDVSRVLEKAEAWFDLTYIETRKEG